MGWSLQSRVVEWQVVTVFRALPICCAEVFVLRKPGLHGSTDCANKGPATSSLPKSSSSSCNSSDSSEAGEALPDQRRLGSRPHRKRTTHDIINTREGIQWLSQLLKDLGDLDSDGSLHKAGQSSTTDQEQASASSEPVSASAESLIKEAFTMSAEAQSSAPAEVQDLEADENSFEKEVVEESGLEEMGLRENKIIQQVVLQACQQSAKSGSTTSPGSDIEKRLSPLIEENMKQGLSAEDAAQEAVLQSYLFDETPEQEQGGEPQPQPPQPPEVAGSGGPRVTTTTSCNVEAQENLQAAYLHWFEECLTSVRALLCRKKDLSEKTTGQNKELSLVHGNIAGSAASKQNTADLPDAMPESEGVLWVHWKEPGITGRPASLDSSNRVKCIVPTGALKDLRNYSNVSIVHPAVGVKMERVRGYSGMLRPQVPSQVLRLRDIWQTALIAKDASCNEDGGVGVGVLPVRVGFEQACFICNKESAPSATSARNASVQQNVGAPDSIAAACPLCLLPAHSKCCSLLATQTDVATFSFPDDVDLSNIDVPDVFCPEGRALGQILSCISALNLQHVSV